MTRKTKCKLLFFSVWPGVQCGARFIENCRMQLRSTMASATFLIHTFHASRTTHTIHRRIPRNSCLSVDWRFGTSCKGVVTKLDTLRRKNFLEVSRDFLTICIFNILRNKSTYYNLYSAVVRKIQLRMFASINNRFFTNICTQYTIDQLWEHHQLFWCLLRKQILKDQI